MHGEIYRGFMEHVPHDGQVHHISLVMRDDGRVVVFMDGKESPPSLPNDNKENA